MESVKPTIASTRSRQNIQRQNYAPDEDEVEEIGNLYQARIPRTFSPLTYPKCQARQILIALLNYFRAGQKDRRRKRLLSLHQQRKNSTLRGRPIRPTDRNHTLKLPSETSAAVSENPDDPGLGPKAYDMKVLGILNQVVQEPVVRIEKKDIPLPTGYNHDTANWRR